MPYEKAIIFDPDFYPFDLIMACLLFSTYCVIRFFRTGDENVLLVDQLQKEHVTKDQFLANTSHELRNPLHVMVNIAQSILRKEEENLTIESKNHLNLLTTVGRRMSYLLNDLIDITKIKQQGISLNREPINLHNTIETVVEMQMIMANEKPLSIKFEIPDKFHPVFADENRLIQILFNLLHNAVKFTDEGEIKISVKKRGNYAVVSIKDNGIGIDREDQSRIFLPYEQGRMSHYNESGGIGLGLSICKQLVEMHGGDLSVQSTFGEGATFSFTLPLSMQRAQGAVKSSPIINEIIKFKVGIEEQDKQKLISLKSLLLTMIR
ncbi:HAMP domain-containing sensor histidine kinase [Priestia megaterium]